METLPPFYPALELLIQYLSEHLGVVVDCKDPEGRGRVRVSVPGLRGKGKENWTDFIEVEGPAIGGTGEAGDQGDWVPLQPGQAVAVRFQCGDPEVLVARPGGPSQKKEGDSPQNTPKEAKVIGKKDPRQRTRLRIRKSEAGHTILFDDRGTKEKLAIIDSVGGGIYIVCPGKIEDEKEKEGEESKPRKGKRRGLKMVINDTAEKPSQACRDDAHLLSILGLMRAGQTQYVTDDYGHWAAFQRGKGGKIVASVFINGKLPRVYLTAGDAQLQVRGDKGDIAVTRQAIKQIDKKAPVEDVIEQMLALQKQEFDEFKE